MLTESSFLPLSLSLSLSVHQNPERLKGSCTGTAGLVPRLATA